MIKKLTLTMMVLFATLTANARCNWNTLTFQQWNQGTYYKFLGKGGGIGDDTCVNWMYTVYDQQTKKTDTLQDWRGYTDIVFNSKGKYTVNFRVWNICTKCDTTITREINLIYFNNCKINYSILSSDGTCNDSLSGRMSLAENRKGDTCWQYYFSIYHGPELDSLSQMDWDSMSDDQLINYYSFNDSDMVIFDGPANKPIGYKFKEDGHYLLITQWYNKCLGQDTFIISRITIELCTTTGIKTFVRPTPKLIQIYDMMGRKVYHIRKDEVLIYLYDDGSTKKVIVH